MIGEGGDKKPEQDEKLGKGLATSRQSFSKIEIRNRQLREQLLRLEEKLWGRKPDETGGR